MKVQLLSLLLVLAALTNNLQAQFVTIPDANFRTRLLQLYPSCFNTNQEMDTTCSAVVNATSLFISGRQFSNVDAVQYFDSLQYLDISLNNLNAIPILPNNLDTLVCKFNGFGGLPVLPNSLRYLDCGHNQLSNITVSLPNTLQYLDCNNNYLTRLPVLPNALQLLNCNNNLLNSLPPLPSSLQYLICIQNQLVSLPTLPNSLLNLDCRYNALTTLPSLPNNLKGLDCHRNNLTILPALPDSLELFECTSNQLTSLPTLPSSLLFLGCGGNRLTNLPALPNSLLSLECSFNQLTTLPVLPSSLRSLYCRYNSQLSCLPYFPNSLNIFETPNSSITCLPNYTQYITASSSGMPLCTNSNQICRINPTARGVVYNDANNNGRRDTLENLIDGITISVSPNNWTNVSDSINGYLVKLDTSPVTNIITPGALPYRNFSPSSYTVTTTSLSMLPTSYDFGIQVTQPNITDLVTRISTWFIRPGFTTFANVNIENIGTIDQTNSSVSLAIPNGLSVISVTPANGIVTGNTVTWSGESIAIFERKNYAVSLQVPATMPLGASLTYTANTTPASADFTPADNIATQTVTVRGSYDPNDKQVNKDRLPNNYVASDEEMLYTIRFQNTGTDTAFTVLIRDTLDLQKLDFSTFRITGASHTLRTNVRERGVVEFVFNNIMLPDSFVNEPLSHGYVQFRIHPKANLPLGTQIKNRAFIYFDFNTPIITNFATTTVGLLSVTGAELGTGTLNLYPVPVAEQLTVNFSAVRSVEVRYRLLDIQGRILQEQQVTVTEGENISTMDMSKLGAGMYVLQVVGEQGSVSQKIVKN